MKIRDAVLSDIDGIIQVADELAETSGYKELGYCRDKWRALAASFIESPNAKVYVATTPKVVGFIALIKEYSFTKKPMAHMYLYYVQRASRGGSAGARLLKASIQCAKEWGVCAYFTGVASGLSSDGNLRSMYGKLGFEQIGTHHRRVF